MKKFTIYWRDGERSVILGESIEHAFQSAGYGAGATRAIGWYDYGDTETHTWDPDTKNWFPKTPVVTK